MRFDAGGYVVADMSILAVAIATKWPYAVGGGLGLASAMARRRGINLPSRVTVMCFVMGIALLVGGAIVATTAIAVGVGLAIVGGLFIVAGFMARREDRQPAIPDSERPRYWPGWWPTGGLNAKYVHNPRKVFWMFVVFGALGVCLLAWAVADPHGFFQGPRSYRAIVGAPLLIGMAAVYAPRAFRAMRAREEGTSTSVTERHTL
jgi:ABC-type Na+ efflux pump permease subunit